MIVENFATTLQQVHGGGADQEGRARPMGDMLGFPKSLIVNYVVRKVKKMVPAYDLPGAVRFNDAVAQGRGKPFKPPRSARTTSPCCSTPAAPPA